MKFALLFAMIAAVLLLLSSLGSYIFGRILLPAMGLMAPGYWTWFWATFVIGLFVFAIKWFANFIAEL